MKNTGSKIILPQNLQGLIKFLILYRLLFQILLTKPPYPSIQHPVTGIRGFGFLLEKPTRTRANSILNQFLHAFGE